METDQRDFYDILGVSRDADAKAIKDAFRELTLRYHPDRNKEPDAEERYKKIVEAYAVLSDPKKRAEYEARGMKGVAGFSREDLFSGIDFGDLFRGTGFDFGFDFGEDIFNRFFGRRRPSRDIHGANVEVDLGIPLEKVVTGGEETVRYSHPQQCSNCGGSGAKPGTKPRACDACKGTGRHVDTRAEKGITIQQVATCGFCLGKGSVIDEPCPQCGGVGKVEKEERIKVKIPRGFEEGMALRIPGRGYPSPREGGVPGDLFVVLRTFSDPRFDRRGSNLLSSEGIGIADATLGGEVEIPTLEKPIKVSIPPGTQSGTVLRLQGKGLPRLGNDRRGDIYLTIEVHIPEHLTSEERELYEKLRELEQKND